MLKTILISVFTTLLTVFLIQGDNWFFLILFAWFSLCCRFIYYLFDNTRYDDTFERFFGTIGIIISFIFFPFVIVPLFFFYLHGNISKDLLKIRKKVMGSKKFKFRSPILIVQENN